MYLVEETPNSRVVEGTHRPTNWNGSSSKSSIGSQTRGNKPQPRDFFISSLLYRKQRWVRLEPPKTFALGESTNLYFRVTKWTGVQRSPRRKLLTRQKLGLTCTLNRWKSSTPPLGFLGRTGLKFQNIRRTCDKRHFRYPNTYRTTTRSGKR